ncbi:MAG TPA: sigma-70 family RNA polymerase sigma factor [Bryobacteraceae bacterium]|jgi:RNA polymerase sigma factor (TIGR02999 family)|nr:sigma-70 family RNA polymerase sigma factor [Bryobacteraceae bacterium]
MQPSPALNVTQLLSEWAKGDAGALDRLMPLVHKELHTLAAVFLQRERPGHTLQPTALVNEAYLRLVDVDQVNYNNRVHFLGMAAHLMRQILVDYARKHRAAKRGAGQKHLPVEDVLVYVPEQPDDLLALDAALQRLAEVDARKSTVVELRFFGGMKTDEIAQVLNVSVNTVLRDWTLARAWLRRELEGTSSEATT